MAAPASLGRNDRIRGGAQMLTGVVTAASRPGPQATSDGYTVTEVTFGQVGPGVLAPACLAPACLAPACLAPAFLAPACLAPACLAPACLAPAWFAGRGTSTAMDTAASCRRVSGVLCRVPRS